MKSKPNWREISGPWNTEPDYLMFQSSGYDCLVRRNIEMGNFCGYVGVSKNHPLFRVRYGDRAPILKWALEKRRKTPVDMDKVSVIGMLCADRDEDGSVEPTPELVFEVHGGITFSGNGIEKMSPDLWYFGFDCAHGHDLIPSLMALIGQTHGAYRDLEYVSQECRSLAKQLARVESAVSPTPTENVREQLEEEK